MQTFKKSRAQVPPTSVGVQQTNLVASNTILILINTITKHSGLKCLGLHVGFGDFQETIPAATGLELNI